MTTREQRIDKYISHTGLMRAGQRVWPVFATISLLILIAAIPQYFSAPTFGVFEDHLFIPADSIIDELVQAINIISFLSAAAALLLAAMLYIKKRTDVMGLFLAYYLLGNGILFAGAIELLYPIWPAAPWVNSFILLPFFFGPATLALVLLFPDGRFIPPWTRWLIPVTFIAIPATFLTGGEVAPLSSSLPPLMMQIITITMSLLAFLITGAAVYSQVYRYRYVSTAEQRLQTKWVIYGFALWLTINILTSISWLRALQLPQGSPVPPWLPVGSMIWVLSSLILPITLTISISRYRLFDIDLLISRTLVYGLLTLGVAAIYIAVVFILGVLFQTQANLTAAFAATAVVAVIFQPLRDWLQQSVNRLVFGERDDPIEALTQMGRRLEAALPPDKVLPALVETIATTLKLPYVAIQLPAGHGERTAAVSGRPAPNPHSLPLLFQGEELGRLIVAPRGPGLPFSAAEKKLLHNIALQAGTAVHAVQLTDDLQQSRRQIVTAREEERRRLRRDLHDGLGPALAGQRLKLDAALDLLEAGNGKQPRDDLDQAALLLRSLKEETYQSIKDLRRIVHGLRPPALDDLGLVEAITAHIEQQSRALTKPQIIFQPPETALPYFSAAVELALYRITLEGLNNVIRHAQAQTCHVTLGLLNFPEPSVLLEIEDDGKGMPATVKGGVGLISMRERARELGGRLDIAPGTPRGTCLRIWIPLLVEDT